MWPAGIYEFMKSKTILGVLQHLRQINVTDTNKNKMDWIFFYMKEISVNLETLRNVSNIDNVFDKKVTIT